MKGLKGYKPVIFVLVLVLFGVGVFFFVTRKPAAESGTGTVSELSKLVDRDYDKNYPPTPREVAAAYTDILMYLHNKECSDSDIEKLVNCTRKLMDSELLSQNPQKSMIAGLKSDIASFKKDNIEIVSYTLPEVSEVTYFTFEDAECAGVKVSFFTKKKDNAFAKTFQQYLFRKDSTGKWKLYGYKQVTS